MDISTKTHPLRRLVLSGALLLFSATLHAQTTATLQDVIRDTPTKVEWTYSPDINQYPVLAQRLAERTRVALERWVEMMEDTSAEEDDGISEESYVLQPFTIMHYNLVTQTPHIVAVFGEGSDYVGGVHPHNFKETYIWLPEKQQWLTTPMLFADGEGWQTLSDYIREDLVQQAKANLEEEGLEWSEAERDCINSGAGPDAENFALFYPLTGEDGLISALRFIFPPYQVGSFADGTWQVDVPVSVMYPHITDEYRGLFISP